MKGDDLVQPPGYTQRTCRLPPLAAWLDQDPTFDLESKGLSLCSDINYDLCTFRVGPTPTPTCLPGQGGIAKADVAH